MPEPVCGFVCLPACLCAYIHLASLQVEEAQEVDDGLELPNIGGEGGYFDHDEVSPHYSVLATTAPHLPTYLPDTPGWHCLHVDTQRPVRIYLPTCLVCVAGMLSRSMWHGIQHRGHIKACFALSATNILELQFHLCLCSQAPPRWQPTSWNFSFTTACAVRPVLLWLLTPAATCPPHLPPITDRVTRVWPSAR